MRLSCDHSMLAGALWFGRMRRNEFTFGANSGMISGMYFCRPPMKWPNICVSASSAPANRCVAGLVDDRHVQMHGASGLRGDRLGHEGGMHAAFLRGLARQSLEQQHLVGQRQRVAMQEIDLQLRRARIRGSACRAAARPPRHSHRCAGSPARIPRAPPCHRDAARSRRGHCAPTGAVSGRSGSGLGAVR